MKKPTIIAMFSGTEIFSENGRILFSLINAFSKGGYPVLLSSDLANRAVGKYGSEVFQLDHVSIFDEIPINTKDKIFLYDQIDQKLLGRKWLQTIRVEFDIFSSFWNKTPILFPYPPHPIHILRGFHTKLLDLRYLPKKVRLFFSGDTKRYNKSHITYPATKIPRLKVINSILESMPDKSLVLKDSQSAEELFSGPFCDKCVIIDTGQTWIDDRFWLDYLAKTDFFLAPPGIVMPMCHNIIEAMAVGTIPVTNYPEWFHPKLEHMENCIAFSDKQDLFNKINLVLGMNQEQISRLRENVIRYYETYLTTERFIQFFEEKDDNHIDILMITERYVAHNASKLNKNSFIIRGPSGLSVFNWRKLLNAFKY